MNFTLIFPEDKDNCIQGIRNLVLMDGPWQVAIKKYRESKSQEQLGYLWGVVLPTISRHIEDTTGQHYSTEDVYLYLIDEYAERKAVTIAGKPKIIKISASKMTIKQMAEFLDSIIRYAAENLHCVVPDPE